MILIGSMEWSSTVARGEFFCPKCNAAKPYQRKVARPFLTLYFVPVVPIGGLREFVLCRNCRERFDSSILLAGNAAEMLRDNSVTAKPTSFEEELLRVIALIIVEDSQVTEAEIQMATRIYQRMTGRELSLPQLQKMCREASSIRVSAAVYLGIAGQNFSYDQKLLAVQAMFAVAGAEGVISPSRMQSLMDARHQLELDDVAFQTAIKDAEQWVS